MDVEAKGISWKMEHLRSHVSFSPPCLEKKISVVNLTKKVGLLLSRFRLQ